MKNVIGVALALLLSATAASATQYTDVQKQRWQTLFDAYRHYGVVKYCHETRKGYLLQWVNDTELDRARAHVKHLEDEAKAVWADGLDTDKLYKSALTYDVGVPVNGQICHLTYVQMLRIQDSQGQTGAGSLVEKDF